MSEGHNDSNRRRHPNAPGFLTTRKATQFKPTRWYSRSYKSLDPQSRSVITAELTQFKRDWQNGLSDKELFVTWNYKGVHNSDACKQWKIKQIRARKDFRVLFVLVDQDNIAWLLEAYRKSSPSVQDAAIARACDRGRTVWEDSRGR